MTTATATAKTERAFRIAEPNLGAAQEWLAKLNKRVARAGLTPYTSEVTDTKRTPVTNEAGLTVGWEEYVELTVRGEVPRKAGWSFIAMVDNDPLVGVTTRVVPGLDENGLNLDQFRDEASVGTCGYCKTDRDRRKLFVVRSDEGQMMQVGSTCVQPFVGMSVASLALFGYMDDLMGSEFEGYGSWGGDPRTDTLMLLLLGAACERRFGFVTRRLAGDTGKQATVDTIREYLNPRMKDKETRRMREDLAEELAKGGCAERAEAVREWAARLPGGSEYERNLKAAAAAESVPPNLEALLVSAVPGLTREENRDAAKAAAATRPPSQWFGEEKKRYNLTGLEVLAVSLIEGYYGPTTLLVMVDDEGRVFKWFASGDWNFERGQRLAGKATVKGFSEWQGEKQTLLSRCKFEVMPDEDKPEGEAETAPAGPAAGERGKLVLRLGDDGDDPVVGEVLGWEDEERCWVAWGDNRFVDDKPVSEIARVEFADDLMPRRSRS